MAELDIELSSTDLTRVTKTLDKWKGAPLKKRTSLAMQRGMKLLVGPIRARTPKKHGGGGAIAKGVMKASVKVHALKLRSGEISAYAVGPTNQIRYPLIRGHVVRAITGGPTYGSVAPVPFVEPVIAAYYTQVVSFVNTQITRLA
jgi:hypothetical protein